MTDHKELKFLYKFTIKIQNEDRFETLRSALMKWANAQYRKDWTSHGFSKVSKNTVCFFINTKKALSLDQISFLQTTIQNSDQLLIFSELPPAS